MSARTWQRRRPRATPATNIVAKLIPVIKRYTASGWIRPPEKPPAGRPSKEEAIFKDKDLMDYVTVTCANECLARITYGRAKVETKCD